jgi:four helix bundle protein
MIEKIARSDQLEDRLVTFAASIVTLAKHLWKDERTQHMAKQMLRSGTAGAANYAEARSAESRADFIHKMRMVEKELNETAVWLRIIEKISVVSRELIVDIVSENKELVRIISASVRTARRRASARMRIED